MTSTAKTAARREAIIMALLVIVGAVLALLLFAAGVLWRGRSFAERPKTSIKYSLSGEKPVPSRRTTRDGGCGFDPPACYPCDERFIRSQCPVANGQYVTVAPNCRQ